MRVLITGGAGFVGANVGIRLALRHPDWELVAFDNLRRRGAELNIVRLREVGIEFVHGDVRELADLLALEPVGALVECSAEPSILAGVNEGMDYLVRTNLLGAYHCLELARRDSAQLIFLSTSRVYPVEALNSTVYVEHAGRFDLAAQQSLSGASQAGFAEDFPLEGARTPYGATKLSAELLVTEYVNTFGLRATVNRCGVIAGPWQMGKVDQGVFTYWMLAHYFKDALEYIGFGGSGKQVRDLLHVDDLADLIEEQLTHPVLWNGKTLNVGGGRESSLSLRETTYLCSEITGNRIEPAASAIDRPGDVRIYISDCGRLLSQTSWRPTQNPKGILTDIFTWIQDNEHAVKTALQQ